MTRIVFVTQCLGCFKRLHAPSETELHKQAERHMRNCNAAKSGAGAIAMPGALQTTEEKAE